LVGALLTPGARTVASVLRVMGRQHVPHFQNYHRVLNRARWSSRKLSQLLLGLLLEAFVPAAAPVIIGIDDHIERRRGPTSSARGLYRDPVRSSKEYFVKVSGLRWLSLQLLVWVPWAQRVWGLPFLTVLAPSERYYQQRKRQPKSLTDCARQAIVQVGRWLPHRKLVVVADSSYAAIELLAYLAGLAHPVTMLTRLRLDAALYDPAPERHPGTNGRPRKKGARQPNLDGRLADPSTVWQTVTARWYGGVQRTLELATGAALWYHSGLPPVAIRWVLVRDPEGKLDSQALLSTDLSLDALQLVEWFVLRWQVEVTFEEARAHLGVETQRQWSDLAILRTTPALFGRYSVVTLLAQRLLAQQECPVRQAAWYAKELPTFVDTLALVRRELWKAGAGLFATSEPTTEVVKLPRQVLEQLTEALAWAS
jgi:hypothetical protein